MQKPSLLLLLVEVDDTWAKHIEDLLTKSNLQLKVKRVTTLKGTLDTLEDADIDAVLMELTLPDGHGVEAFDQVNQFDVPIIAMTERDNEELAQEVIARGGQDYVVKNGVMNSRGLKRAICHAIGRNTFIKHKVNEGLFCRHELKEASQVLRESTESIKDTNHQFGALYGQAENYQRQSRS